jgi:hypothetical protein
MIDLPHYGYIHSRILPIDPGGVVPGTLGGPSDIVERPGYRYAVTYSLPPLHSEDEARLFQSKLEKASREDASYLWPLDFRPPSAGTPLINGASPTGAVIPIKGLFPGYSFREGQPVAVISEGVGFVHRVATPTIAGVDGTVILPVFPLTRKAFLDNDVVEIEKPRIRGVLTWEPSGQPAHGWRPFEFTITERR